MLDLGYLHNKDTSIVQEFYGNVSTSLVLQMDLPRNKSFVYILCGGPGGNGGPGFSGASLTQRGGGGGGGSGGLSTIILPRYVLPNVLYINLGVSGSNTYVGLNPSGTSDQLILRAGSGSVGNTGSATAGGAVGAGGAAATIATSIYAPIGIFNFDIGVNGGIGAASAAGSSVSAFVSFMFTGGAGGAGVTSGNVTAAGGQISATTGINQQIDGGVAGGGAGNKGYPVRIYRGAWGFLPGSGGGSGGTTAGGAGGNGSWCSGGGGGGAGNGGGAGGLGGPGYAMIACF